ncbi:MAG: pirin family protein [Planctomycetota bacterium]|nr:pirin family protein [Planctomycetota bacterium]
MITPRRSDERGAFDFGWLDTKHTFSFGQYQDPRHMGFGPLRVINEDRVAPAQGFGMHPHRDMEIVSVVVSGTLEHQDSLGHRGQLGPGEVQRITAGRGVRHSEYNPSGSEPVHFLQIWIEPREKGLEPGYAQQRFDPVASRNSLTLLASPDGAEGSISINQDVRLFRTGLEPGKKLRHDFAPGRRGWVQIISGSVSLGGVTLNAGDGASIAQESAVELTGLSSATDVLLFDLP